MAPSVDTQYANKVISWAIMQAGTLFHKPEPFMLGFVFFELWHYFVVAHSYSRDEICWAANASLNPLDGEHIPTRHKHFLFWTKSFNFTQ